MLSARKFLRYSACLIASPWRARVPAVRVELRPVPRWSRKSTYKMVEHQSTNYKVNGTHLITLAEYEFNPGVRLRGTTSKTRATLQVDQPRKLALFGILAIFFSWLYGFVQATDTSCKEPQRLPSGLAVVHRDIEEQLGDPKFSWISNYQYRDQWASYWW